MCDIRPLGDVSGILSLGEMSRFEAWCWYTNAENYRPAIVATFADIDEARAWVVDNGPRFAGRLELVRQKILRQRVV